MIKYHKTAEHFIETNSGQPSMASMHYHNSYELYYLEAGKREYFVEDKFFTVSTGDFVLIKPSVFHRTGSGYALRTLVGFTEEFLAKTYSPSAIKKMVKCFEKPLICPSESEQEEIKGLLKVLSKSSDHTDFAIYLGVLLQRLSKCAPDNSYDKRISSIIKYINMNFSELHSIEQIADYMHISKQHLCRLFKNSTGITLIDYMNTIKVKNACIFLETSNKGLVEIWQLCGFNSSAYFSTVFKSIMGMSPSKYRKEHKKG